MVGGMKKNFWLMVVGRAVFGPCYESRAVTMLAILPKFFGERELGLAIAILISSGRVGSLLSSYTTPWVYELRGLDGVLQAGTALCVFALGCTACVYSIDSRIS